MKELFDTFGPVVQQGAFAVVIILAFVVRYLLKRVDTLETKLDESQRARISSGEVLALVIERNTVATKELGELIHDLSEQATAS